MVLILLNLGDCVSNMCQEYLLIIPFWTKNILCVKKKGTR